MSETNTANESVDEELARLVAEGESPNAGSPTTGSIAGTPKGLRRSRRVENAAVLVPALTAAYVSFTFGGLDSGAGARAAVLGLAILTTGALLRSFTYPHDLMRVSRLIVAILPALAGGFVAGMLAISDAYGLAATSLMPATALALFAAIAVEVGGRRLLAENPLRVAVLGSPTFAAGLSREIAADSAQAVEVVGWLNPTAVAPAAGSHEAEGQADGSQIGTLDSIRAAITEHEIDLIVRGPGLGGSRRSRRTYDAIAEGCVDLPVRMIDGNQFYEQLFGHVPLGTIGSDWFLYIMHPSFQGTPPATKRIFDLVGAGLASLVALPLIAAAALAIKLEDRGPVFYRQRRVGEGGREYAILKLRSMSADAEASGAQWSSPGDTRITRVGRVLRRTHIDELPQIFNVLRGEMTLVGPRPERPEMIAELERLFPHYKRRLLVKPGVTGWAQVRCGYAGSEVGTAWKLCHDLFYLKHRSVLADCLIVIETMAIAAKDAHRPMRAPQAEFLFGSDGIERISPPADRPLDAEPETRIEELEPIPEISLTGPTPAWAREGAA